MEVNYETSLGFLVGAYRALKEQLPEISEDNLIKLVITEFEQHKLDKRTEMIQGYKKQNIKNMRED